MGTKLRPEKMTLLNLKVTAEERKALVQNAKKFAKGNLSLWLRYSGLNHVPRKKDLE